MHRVMQRAIGTASDWDLGLRCCSCNPELPGFTFKVVLLSWLPDGRCCYSPVAASEAIINTAGVMEDQVLTWLAQLSSALSALAVLVLSQIEIGRWNYESWGKDCHIPSLSLLQPCLRFQWIKDSGKRKMARANASWSCSIYATNPDPFSWPLPPAFP